MQRPKRSLRQRAWGRLGRGLGKLVDRGFFRHAGGERRPVFFDVERTQPALRVIDQNYDVIRQELMAILPRKDSIPRYHEVDGSQYAISAQGEAAWRTFFVSLSGVGERLPNRALCPRTAEIVERIPGLLDAFFSILEPGKSVPAHDGPHLYYLRYHTAFVVPRENPPRLRVKDQYYTWKERESVLFDDSWNHEVENHAREVRVVLITDFLRPAPWYLRTLFRLHIACILRSVDEHDVQELFQKVAIK
jgi:aspartyl/asparaginyl beta-hydroxylase (cupin superfamily)